MHITKKRFIVNIGITFLYTCFSVLVYYVVRHGVHMMLAWNIILAFIPMGIVFLYDQKYVKKTYLVIILFLLWLLFYPNAFYVVTDLIYLESSDFMVMIELYLGDSYQYIDSVSAYLGLFHMLFGVIIAGYFGLISLISIYDHIKDSRLSNYRDLFIIIVSFLSAAGIYIGRFFRYNSWELYRVFAIISDFFTSISWFMVFFICMVGIMQLGIFYLVILNRKTDNLSERKEDV